MAKGKRWIWWYDKAERGWRHDFPDHSFWLVCYCTSRRNWGATFWPLFDEGWTLETSTGSVRRFKSKAAAQRAAERAARGQP